MPSSASPCSASSRRSRTLTEPHGRLFVIAGPSGVGKGTVVRRVLERVPGLFLSVSATTRRPRPVERDGVDYVFVTQDEFDRMIEEDELLEWADVFGNRYGTPAAPILRVLRTGRDALLEIDVQGARQVKDRMPQAVLILLEPPSLAELERRLRARGTEDEERLERRLARAGWELEQRGWFDHAVVNEDLETASGEVAAIIASFPQVSDPAGGPEAEGTEADGTQEGSSNP